MQCIRTGPGLWVEGVFDVGHSVRAKSGHGMTMRTANEYWERGARQTQGGVRMDRADGRTRRAQGPGRILRAVRNAVRMPRGTRICVGPPYCTPQQGPWGCGACPRLTHVPRPSRDGLREKKGPEEGPPGRRHMMASWYA